MFESFVTLLPNNWQLFAEYYIELAILMYVVCYIIEVVLGKLSFLSSTSSSSFKYFYIDFDFKTTLTWSICVISFLKFEQKKKL